MQKQADTVSKILTTVARAVKVGVSLLELEQVAVDECKRLKAKPYNKGYKPQWAKEPYPAVLCTSVNDVISHGIPTPYKLQDGDIVTIDIGIVVDGLCADAALTVWAGDLDGRDERLLRYSRRAVYEGIEIIKDGVDVKDIGEAIYWYCNRMGYITNAVFVGHRIGKEMHEDPPIPMTRLLKDDDPKGVFNAKLKAGDVVCIEPHLTYKDEAGFTDKDGWSRRTRDGRKSAMFEHMVEVTKNGYKILTSHFEKEVL